MPIDVRRLFRRGPVRFIGQRMANELNTTRPPRTSRDTRWAIDDSSSEDIVEETSEEIESSASIMSMISEDGPMIPMVPDPQWMDENGWEFVAFRPPRRGEVFISRNLALSTAHDEVGDSWNGCRWVIRPRVRNQANNTVAQVTTVVAEPTGPRLDPPTGPIPEEL